MDSLRKMLAKNNNTRNELWDSMFVKYQTLSETVDKSFAVEDLMYEVIENENLFLNIPVIQSVIENDLNSNCKQLILRKEATKILNNTSDFIKASRKLKKEVLNLIKHDVAEKDIVLYIAYCKNNLYKDKYGCVIEENLNSDLRLFLTKQFEFSDDHETFVFWNNKLKHEWQRLTDYIDEEYIIIVALQFIKEWCSATKTCIHACYENIAKLEV